MKKGKNQPLVTVLGSRSCRRAAFYDVRTRDIYDTWPQVVQRRFVRIFTGALNWYLKRHPDLTHEHPKNITRRLAYIPRAMRAWKGYMPGGFATFYAHNPHRRTMKNGAKTDLITRAFFRHTYDAAGLRSRSSVLAWCVEEYIREHKQPLHWLSVAGGSGQPQYDVLVTLTAERQEKIALTILDIDPDILSFAEELYVEQNLQLGNVQFIQGNVFRAPIRSEAFAPAPNIVDAMGLFEYLTDAQAISLIKIVQESSVEDALFVFTNMREQRPELETHKRALGWPGVIQRSEEQVLHLLQKAGVSLRNVEVFCPQDRVYNIYKVTKI